MDDAPRGRGAPGGSRDAPAGCLRVRALVVRRRGLARAAHSAGPTDIIICDHRGAYASQVAGVCVWGGVAAVAGASWALPLTLSCLAPGPGDTQRTPGPGELDPIVALPRAPVPRIGNSDRFVEGLKLYAGKGTVHSDPRAGVTPAPGGTVPLEAFSSFGKRNPFGPPVRCSCCCCCCCCCAQPPSRHEITRG